MHKREENTPDEWDTTQSDTPNTRHSTLDWMANLTGVVTECVWTSALDLQRHDLCVKGLVESRGSRMFRGQSELLGCYHEDAANLELGLLGLLVAANILIILTAITLCALLISFTHLSFWEYSLTRSLNVTGSPT